MQRKQNTYALVWAVNQIMLVVAKMHHKGPTNEAKNSLVRSLVSSPLDYTLSAQACATKTCLKDAIISLLNHRKYNLESDGHAVILALPYQNCKP